MAAFNQAAITDLLKALDIIYPSAAKAIMVYPWIQDEMQKGLYLEKLKGSTAVTVSEAEIKAAALAHANHQSFKGIDCFTAYDIFDKLIYPTITNFVVGLKDHPSQPNNIKFSSCGGVNYGRVFGDDGKFTNFVDTILTNLAYGKQLLNQPNFLDSGTTLAQSIKDYKLKSLNVLAMDFANENERKTAFNLLCTNESFLKLYMIAYIGMDTGLYFNPFSMLRVDPYLAYLVMFLGHVGDGSLQAYGGTEGIIKGFNTTNWPEYAAKGDAERAKLPEAATKVLQEVGKWLASKKTDPASKAYYEYWNGLFITDKKCLINMLVIINEIVNVGQQYPLTPTAAGYQTAIGTAYKNFSIEIAD